MHPLTSISILSMWNGNVMFMTWFVLLLYLLQPSLLIFCRIRIEMVLLKSNVLNEAQRSMLDGGMRVEDLPVNPSPRSGSLSSHLGQPRPPPDSADGCKALLGGPAGLWHFIYRSIYLDQYVSSEFSSPINTPKQQKR